MSVPEREPEKCDDCGKNIRASDFGICNACELKRIEDSKNF